MKSTAVAERCVLQTFVPTSYAWHCAGSLRFALHPVGVEVHKRVGKMN